MSAPELSAFDSEGRYLIANELGSGTFGIVYRVFDTVWQEHVALKTIHEDTLDDRRWLKEEYRLQADIAHRNLVTPGELKRDGKRYFFTMKLVEDGIPFDQRLDFDRQGPATAQRQSIRRICAAALQLAEALAHVHEAGMCHGDIKPSNVLVDANDWVALLDFGLTRSLSRVGQASAQPEGLLGTLDYLAPERYDGNHIQPASDWYSFALMLYQTLTGTLAYSGEPLAMILAKQQPPPAPRTLLPVLPLELDGLLAALISPAPDARPSGERIIECLRTLAEIERRQPTWHMHDNEAEQLFVGRDAELRRLQAAFADSANGQPSTIEVVGPSGIGKSALIRHFLAGLETLEQPPLLLSARCHPHESLPYKAFDAIIDGLARHWERLPEAASQAIQTLEGIRELSLLFPDLAALLPAAEGDPASARRGDPRTLRQQAFRGLRAFVNRLAERQPLVMWVDDMQWADADSVALIKEVFGSDNPPRILLLFSRRADEPAANAELVEVIDGLAASRFGLRIDLGQLDDESSGSLALAILSHGQLVSTTLINAIVTEASGVPYLVSEFAHSAAELEPDLGVAELAPSVAELMRRKLSNLTPADRNLLELAALSGDSQSSTILLSAASSADRHRLRDLCVRRLLRWTIQGSDAALQVYHDHLREFVLDELAEQTRLAHHHALLTAMEQTGTADPEHLLRHALAVGDSERAHVHATRAAQRAADALAFRQSARFYGLALEHAATDAPRAELHGALASALADAGQSTLSAPAFELASQATLAESNDDALRADFFRRRAGEQYLKAGHFDDGLRLMSNYLADNGVALPRTGRGALVISASRRLHLYLRKFEKVAWADERASAEVRSRLADLWAATTALSMMDPVRADVVGLKHFHEALDAGDSAHVARSCGYEAAFAALIGGSYLRAKSRKLLTINRRALGREPAPYNAAFYQLCAGTSAFFHSNWTETVALCDRAATAFRSECRGAEYEAAVALVFSLQALGQAGEVAQLVQRIPESIEEADARGDLFAANNYRGGFHALGRIAAGQIDAVQADLRKVVETWTPGFYQMHAYHRVFAGVAADLYIGDPFSALARIDGDWPELEAGLFLYMELPAMELRWARARACLAAASLSSAPKRQQLLQRAHRLTRQVAGASVVAAQPHSALLRAAKAAIEERDSEVVPELEDALRGYSLAHMALHTEVVRWTLGHLTGGPTGAGLVDQASTWMVTQGVPEMRPLVAALAPGLERSVS